MKKERKAADVLVKKTGGGKKVRKTVLSEEMEMNSKNNMNVAAFSAGDLVDQNGGEGEEGSASAEGEVEGEVEVDVSAVGVDEKESVPPPLSLKSASRPGITSERIQNILDPYVTGIAVRP